MVIPHKCEMHSLIFVINCYGFCLCCVISMRYYWSYFCVPSSHLVTWWVEGHLVLIVFVTYFCFDDMSWPRDHFSNWVFKVNLSCASLSCSKLGTVKKNPWTQRGTQASNTSESVLDVKILQAVWLSNEAKILQRGAQTSRYGMPFLQEFFLKYILFFFFVTSLL